MKKALLVFVCIITGIIVNAQTYSAWWPAVKIDKNLNKKTTVRFEHETRYVTSIGELYRLANSLELDYSISKPFNFGIAYTHIYNHDIKNDLYANRHRYYLYLRFKQKHGRFSYSLREKFQSTFMNEKLENPKYNPKNALRTKAEIVYNIKSISLKPYINGQFRYIVNNPKKNKIDQTRWSVGAEYKFNKTFFVDFYFQKQSQVNKSNPDIYNILGTTLKVKLK